MNIPTPISEPSRSRARVLAAAKTKAWRDARKAEAEADNAIVRGLVEAVSGYIAPDGRMKARAESVDLHSVVVGAMAILKVSADIETRDAMDRVIARLTHAATPRS
ncbi:hypothetical protein MKK88_21240 [Methylobacterium sp. E-005]|uniref:hypothetical protein n=1 Tax=Methylobacterium sp. E-005 TaxID=2836549 RepID=UPI001FBA3446|nr:hypothetical protein [Methylobacterium sp. E-005]MCJ2088486.1 hypothetical protein [Methylobacterium sp. E-005]